MLKKASMGIGTLIIFISAILASAFGAGVIIYTQNRLQNEALSTGAEARESVGTSVIVESIRAENIINRKANEFTLRVRIGPASSPIRLNQISLSVLSRDSSTSLIYGGEGNDVFFTNKEQRVIKENINDSFVRLRSDLDNDLIEDYVKVLDSTTLLFNLSSDGLIEVEIPDISVIESEIDFIGKIGNTNSHIQILGTVKTPNVLCENIKVIILPEKVDQGIFSIVNPYRENTLAIKQEDLIRVYFETSKPVGEETKMSIGFFTTKATAHRRDVVTPSTMTGSSANIFP